MSACRKGGPIFILKTAFKNINQAQIPCCLDCKADRALSKFNLSSFKYFKNEKSS